MIQVTIEVKGKTVCRRMRVTAPSVERALELAGAGRPDKRVRVVFPVDSEDILVRNGVPGGMPPGSGGLETAA